MLDVISNFFLTSDSGCYTNVYHETRLEDVERTMIYLLTPEKFPLWLYEKTAKFGIEKLTENTY